MIVVLLCRFVPKGKYILTPCPISYAEEQLLHFFGQLLGIAIRADVPLPLDLLGSFWKGLVGEPLDPEQDLQEADLLTYNYVKKFEGVRDSHLDMHIGHVSGEVEVIYIMKGGTDLLPDSLEVLKALTRNEPIKKLMMLYADVPWFGQ